MTLSSVGKSYNGDFQRLQWSLLQMWNFCIANNSRVYNTELWQDKTWQRQHDD